MLRIRLIGQMTLELDGAPLALPKSARARSLLAWLAAHPGSHSRGAVAARFWPETLDASAGLTARTDAASRARVSNRKMACTGSSPARMRPHGAPV